MKAGCYGVKHKSLIDRGTLWAVAKPGEPAEHTVSGFRPSPAVIMRAHQR